MPFCPSCRQEFESFAKSCPDCEVELAAELPAEPTSDAPETADFYAADVDSAHALLEVIQSAGVPVVPGEMTADDRPILIVPSVFAKSVSALLDSADTVASDGGDPPTYRSVEPEPVEEEEGPDLSVLGDSVRRLAARGEEVIGPLLDIVRRGEGDDRKKAVLAISAMGPVGQKALATQATILADEGRDQALFAVVTELRDRRPPREDLAGLEALAVDAGRDPEIRASALHALGRFPQPDLAGPIFELLGDEHPEVQEAADEALCNLLDDDVDFDSRGNEDERKAAIGRWQEKLAKRGVRRR